MNQLISMVFLVGGALAAIAVGLMCGLTLLVWLGGGQRHPLSEAWRSADEW